MKKKYIVVESDRTSEVLTPSELNTWKKNGLLGSRDRVFLIAEEYKVIEQKKVILEKVKED